MSLKRLTAATAMFTAIAATAALAEPVEVAGSSTVFPYAMMSGDTFVENHDLGYPNVETIGSSKGLKRFCEGVGADTLDIATASRKIKAKEIKACAENGVTDIIEVRIGYDGLVFASAKKGPSFNFVPADWYQALAARVLVDGALAENPYTSWAEFNADLPDVGIRTFIPASSHGTREVFDQKMMLAGCKATGAYDLLLAENGGDAKAAGKACLITREGKAVEELEVTGTETLDKMRGAKGSIALLGLAFYETNVGELQAATVEGVTPSSDVIANGEYLVSRPLFMYVKKANIALTPGIKEYVQTVLSDELSGPGGFLTIFGLVADPELASTRDMVANEVTMGASS